MFTINDCKVRYWIGSPDLMNGRYGYYGDSVRKALEDLSDLLPPYLLHNDGDYSYVYFAVDPDPIVLRLLRGRIIYHDCFWEYHREDLG